MVEKSILSSYGIFINKKPETQRKSENELPNILIPIGYIISSTSFTDTKPKCDSKQPKFVFMEKNCRYLFLSNYILTK